MGGGSWTSKAYDDSIKSRGFASKADIKSAPVQAFYRARHLNKDLDPKGIIRECADSEEHPNTLPIILALDVTGSMGEAAKSCASKLDDIMVELYKKYKDVEFMMMGIGDLNFDEAPIQVTQFESDIRILDQTSKIWFERGGGPNSWESYTAVWFFGLYRTKLDCWKRGKKGIIITMGDEAMNPYLHRGLISDCLDIQMMPEENYDTKTLYNLAKEKFDIYHIGITDPECCFKYHADEIHKTWKPFLGQRYLEGSSDDLPKLISAIVEDASNGVTVDPRIPTNWESESDGIRW